MPYSLTRGIYLEHFWVEQGCHKGGSMGSNPPIHFEESLIALIDYFASLSYMTMEAFDWKSSIWKGIMHPSIEIHNNKGLGKALVFLLALKDKSWKSSQSWILFTLEILFEVVVVRSTPILSSECPRFALTILILSLRLVSKVRG